MPGRIRKNAGGPPKRQDTDGGWYTKRQFSTFYGGYAQWDAAPHQHQHHHQPPRKYRDDEARPFVPTGGGRDEDSDEAPYDVDFDGAWVPPRLSGKQASLINQVNDWHFPMLNDHPRNEFYREALSKIITPESCVLEIGAGTGLLSMIAASLGAKHVVAIEANQQLVALGRQIIELNGFSSKITVIHRMSDEVGPGLIKRHFDGSLADVLVSELLGTLLLSESALNYVSDAVKRLCRPEVAVVPRTGRQIVTLAESEDMEMVSSVTKWGGFDLTPFNKLQDTPKLVYSKVLGARFNTLRSRWMSDPIEVIGIDFLTETPGRHVWPAEKRFPFRAVRAGTIHCAVASWEVDAPGTSPMSTHPDATRDNLARDAQWGQGIQLLEDGQEAVPKRLTVEEGEWLDLVMRCSKCGVFMQLRVERRSGPPEGQ